MLYRSLFAYFNTPYRMRHGPTGYSDYSRYKPWLRDEFQFRCVYCLVRELWIGGKRLFVVEHHVPQAHDEFLIREYSNLRYACKACNEARGDRPVLDLCAVGLAAHLIVHEDGNIEGLTDEGKDHIRTLALNRADLTQYRAKLINLANQWETAATPEARQNISEWFGYPPELPDLTVLRPPGGNSRPEGLRDCHFERHQRRELSDHY